MLISVRSTEKPAFYKRWLDVRECGRRLGKGLHAATRFEKGSIITVIRPNERSIKGTDLPDSRSLLLGGIWARNHSTIKKDGVAGTPRHWPLVWGKIGAKLGAAGLVPWGSTEKQKGQKKRAKRKGHKKIPASRPTGRPRRPVGPSAWNQSGRISSSNV
jgi:hypothetical protein